MAFPTILALAQGTISVTTDKPAYEYGETIEVSVTIINETQTLFRLSGSSSCQADFVFDSFDSARHKVCTLDAIQIDFNPGSWRTWTWEIDPTVLGLPSVDGDHTIVGYYGGTTMADTITVSAPAFLGGQLRVGIPSTVSDDDLAPVKESLQATVLESNTWLDGRRSEVWQTSGVNLEAAVALYANDSRFYSIDTNRILRSARIVAIEEPEIVQEVSNQVSIYPNPCSSRICHVNVHVLRPQVVTMSVYDALGRSLSHSTEFIPVSSSGHRLDVDTSSFHTGFFFVVVRGIDFSVSSGFSVIR
ncbi:hypothetical protein HQ496_03210 [bacterium]|nr:hypothetical protein [bacterium]